MGTSGARHAAHELPAAATMPNPSNSTPTQVAVIVDHGETDDERDAYGGNFANTGSEYGTQLSGAWRFVDVTSVGERRRALGEQLRYLYTYVMPFGLHERTWFNGGTLRARLTTLVAVLALVILAIGGSIKVYSLASGAASRASHHAPTFSSSSAPASGVMIQQTNPTPAVAAPASRDLIGAWVSDSTPTSGSVQVFVRLTQSLQAVANTPVDITIAYPDGSSAHQTAITDAYGLATFTVSYGGFPSRASQQPAGTSQQPAGASQQQPVTVTATATFDNQTLSANTSFFPS